MFFGAIWIKAISLIVIGFALLVSSVVAYKKLKWKLQELAVCIIISLGFLIYGGVHMSYAVNPTTETVTVEYLFESSRSHELFARRSHFEDSEGNLYVLDMDLLTSRKIFYGKDFEEGKTYIITYETKSEVIVGIDENENE